MVEFSVIWEDGKLYSGTYEMSPKYEYAVVVWEILADKSYNKTVVITPETIYNEGSQKFWSGIFKEQ